MYAAPDCARDAPRVSRYWIPGGALGIELTVVYMRAVVAASEGNPLLRRTASGIVSGAPSCEVAAERIRAWLDEHTRFEPDPVGVELIREPALMVRTVACEGEAVGDCDDVAVLGAALGLAVGIPARFVLVAFEDAGLYQHVYTELLTPRPVELDTTRPAQMPAGLQVARVGIRRSATVYHPACSSCSTAGLGAVSQTGPNGDGWTTYTRREPEWWREPVSAAADAIADRLRPTDPYGPGATAPAVPATAPRPANGANGAPALTTGANALLLGAIVLGGLKLARVI